MRLKNQHDFGGACKQGIDIHFKNEYALCCAARMGHLPVVRFMVSLGADIHAENAEALRLSASNGHLPVVQYLVSQGSDVSAGISYAAIDSPVEWGWVGFRRSQEEQAVFNRSPQSFSPITKIRP